MARKYNSENLLPALHLFIEARNKAIEAGITDNGGAIHSVEHIVDMLSMHLCHPQESHINNLKSDPSVEINVDILNDQLRNDDSAFSRFQPAM